MDFDDTPEEAAFRAEVRSLARGATPRPKTGTDADWLAGAIATGSSTPSGAAAVRGARSGRRTLYDDGWAGIAWPKEYGGRGGTRQQSIDLRPGGRPRST